MWRIAFPICAQLVILNGQLDLLKCGGLKNATQGTYKMTTFCTWSSDGNCNWGRCPGEEKKSNADVNHATNIAKQQCQMLIFMQKGHFWLLK